MDVLDFAIAPLPDYLPDGTYEVVCARARRVSYSDGQAVHARGDDEVRLRVVAEGAFRLGRFQPGGSFNLLTMLGVGGHFGDIALQRKTHSHDAFSVGTSEVMVLGAKALEELLTTLPGFAMGLWRANTARLNALLELYDDARTLGIVERLAKVVYLHAGRGEVPDGVACLQRDLAELLGVSQVSIGNALKDLEKENLVEPGYRCVRVPDKDRLSAWLRRCRAI